MEEGLDHALEHFQHVVALHERHLAVNLSELRLTVGPEVLVPEAAHDLEVAVVTGHHEELFLLLGTLGQGVELAGVHSRRHHEVAGSLGSGLNQIRGLYLHKALAVQVVAYLVSHTVTQHQILLQWIAAQVEIAVLHTQVITAVGLVLNGERRSGSRIEHVKGVETHLDVTGIDSGVFALTLQNCTRNLYYVFAAQFLHLSIELCRSRFVDDNLCDTVTVPEVDEAHTAHLPDPLDPTGQSNFLSGVCKAKLAACVCPVHNL